MGNTLGKPPYTGAFAFSYLCFLSLVYIYISMPTKVPENYCGKHRREKKRFYSSNPRVYSPFAVNAAPSTRRRTPFADAEYTFTIL